MNPSDALALSCYQEIGTLNEAHHTALVQHKMNGQVYVKKTLSVYNSEIYRFLQDNPINGIPKIAEIVENEGRLIVIEEYISGQTLRSALDNRNLFAREEAVSITEQVCGIVRRLHSARPPILHRDIKPSNIILTPDNRIRLLDMNAAKRENPAKTEDTALIGTVGYAAPEQYGFGSSTVQTDIYSIGVLLCELITGSLPKEKMPDGRLGEIVRKCTRIDPKDRYRSVDDLIDALDSCHRDLTDAACPPPAGTGHANRGGARPKAGTSPGKTDIFRFTLPGFRTGNPVNMLIAACVYAALLWLSLTFKAEGISQGATLWIERFIYLIFGTAALLFTGNYLDIWDRIRINRVKNPLLRLILILVIDALVLILMVFVMILAAVFTGAYQSTLIHP